MTSRSEAETVLVIGGRGFVGSHVVRAIAAAGHRPHLFGPAMQDDLLADLAGAFDESQGSIEDREAIVAAIKQSGARSLVNTAAYSAGRQGLMKSGDADADRAFAINVTGFRNVLDAAVATDLRRVVWTGSTVVYGPAETYAPGRLDEAAPTGPVTLYGLTKLLSEDLGRYYHARHGLEIVNLRLPLLLGPGLWYQGAASAITGVIRAAAPGHRHAVVFHDEPTDLMHVGDAARAVVETLFHPGPLDTDYNINGFTARLSDVVAEVETAVPGYRVEHRASEPSLRFPLIDDGRFRTALGFAPAYGLADLVAELVPETAA